MGIGLGGDPNYGSYTPYGSPYGTPPSGGGYGTGTVGVDGYGVGMPTGPVGTGSTGIGYGGYGGAGGTPNSYYWNPQGYRPGTDGGQTPLGGIMSEQDPQTAFYRYGQQMGVPDDQSAFGRWFASQYPKFATGYAATTVSDPFHANVQGYANSLGNYNDWQARFAALAPQVRGLDPSSRGGGSSRWVSR